MLWLGGEAVFLQDEENPEFVELILPSQSEDNILTLPVQAAEWFSHLLPQLSVYEDPISFDEMDDFYQRYFQSSIEDLVYSDVWNELRDSGLIVLR